MCTLVPPADVANETPTPWIRYAVLCALGMSYDSTDEQIVREIEALRFAAVLAAETRRPR